MLRDMAVMFKNAVSFNQDIGNWDVSSVTDMSSMFLNASEFNQDIGLWDVSKANTMFRMFSGAAKFNQDISNWSLDSVRSVGEMFTNAKSFDQNLGNWDIDSIIQMSRVFDNSAISVENYDSILIAWQAKPHRDSIFLGVVGLEYCAGDSARNLLIDEGWTFIGDTVNPDCFEVTKNTHFVTTWKTDLPGSTNDSSIKINTLGPSSFNYDIDWDNDGVFDTLGVTGDITHKYPAIDTYTVRIRGIFPRIAFNNDQKIISIDQWGTIKYDNLSRAFENCRNLKYNATDAPDLSNVTDMSFMFAMASAFNPDTLDWDVSNVTNMSFMFDQASLFNAYIGNWNVSNVTLMSAMFKFTAFNQPINNWDVSNVINMTSMFLSTFAFNQPLNNWDVSNVTNMNTMFRGSGFNQPLNNWNVSNVTDMGSMFLNAGFNQEIANWDVSQVTDMSFMFSNNLNFNQSLNTWDVSNVINMGNMFANTEFRPDSLNWSLNNIQDMSSMFFSADSFNAFIGNWNVSNVTDMSSMFEGAVSFDQDLSAWEISSVADLSNAFDNTGLSTANYDSILINWQAKPHQQNVSFGAEGLVFCAGDSARSLLIADGWTFNGDTLDCNVVGINEEVLRQEKNIKLYPNPSVGIVRIKVPSSALGSVLRIYKMDGKLIKETRIMKSTSTIDLSGHENGLYLVRYGDQSSKIILQY